MIASPRPGVALPFYIIILLAFSLLGMGFLLAWGILDGNWVIAVIAGAAIGVSILVGFTALAAPDKMESEFTDRTLTIASSTLGFIREGLTPEGCRSVCAALLAGTRAIAVAMTDRENVLAYVGELEPEFPPGSPIRTPATREVIEGGATRTFASITPDALATMETMDAAERMRELSFRPAGIVSPLTVRGQVVGAIKFYYDNYRDIDRTEHAVVEGFAELLSTQLALSELDRQAHLATEAEVRALQAQINPHFLFNTINTIAALIRTEPVRARELLREFAVFYRQTLENSEGPITLEQELEQTRRYLVFEYARFGRDRIREAEHIQAGLDDVLVPAFIIQPLVENAVRHAMRETGVLHIDVHASVEGDDLIIDVADDGAGMKATQVRRLMADAERSDAAADDPTRGTGTALRNVRERIVRQFGPGSGLEILSRPDEGTVITLRLAGALRHRQPAIA